MAQVGRAGLAGTALVALVGALLVALLGPAQRAQATPAALTVTPAQAAAVGAATNTIYNWGPGGVGVIHSQDHISVNGKYDAVLPVYGSTWHSFGWTTAAGFYIGPGYCADAYRHDHGLSGSFPFQGTLGAGRHFIGTTTSYILQIHRC